MSENLLDLHRLTVLRDTVVSIQGMTDLDLESLDPVDWNGRDHDEVTSRHESFLDNPPASTRLSLLCNRKEKHSPKHPITVLGEYSYAWQTNSMVTDMGMAVVGNAGRARFADVETPADPAHYAAQAQRYVMECPDCHDRLDVKRYKFRRAILAAARGGMADLTLAELRSIIRYVA